MSFRVAASHRLVPALALVAVGVFGLSMANAQTPPAQSAEDQQLEALLTGNDLFFKKTFSEPGQRWEYQVAWNMDGETTMLNLYVRNLATMSDGSRIFVAYVWTPVFAVAQGQELPPSIIKAVAAINDNLLTGNVSAVGNGVYANSGVVMKDLTADALWFYLWAMHDTRVQLKKELDKLVAGG